MSRSRGTAWVKIGLRTTQSTPASLYIEIKRADKAPRSRTLRTAVPAGERHSVSIVSVRRQRRYWRIKVDGRLVRPLVPLGGRGWTVFAAVKSDGNDRSPCSRYEFRFEGLAMKPRMRAKLWKPLQGVPYERGDSRLLRPASRTLVALDEETLERRGDLQPEQPGPTPAPPPTAPPPAPPPLPPAPPPLPPTGLFRADWETGDYRPWSGVQHRNGGDAAEQLSLVTSPVRQGRYAASFVVRPGDRLASSPGERCEVVWMESAESEGQEHWYAWSTLFPEDWTAPNEFGIILQWHTEFAVTNAGPPPIALNARADSLHVTMNTGLLARTATGSYWGAYKRDHPVLASLNKGEWNDFVIRVRWSATSAGALTVWQKTEDEHSYVKRLDLSGIPTLQTYEGRTPAAYVKLGLYRWIDTREARVYHDDFRRAPALMGLQPETIAGI